MEPKPVEHGRPPAYPTRREVLTGASAFALASLTRCVFVYAEGPAVGVSVAPIFEHGEGRGATGCVVIVPPVFLSEEESLQIVNEALVQHGVQLVRGTVVRELMIAPRCMKRFEAEETKEKADRDEKAAVPHRTESGTGNVKFVEDVERAAPLRMTGIDGKKSIAAAFVCEQNYKAVGGVDRNNGTIIERDGKRSFRMSTVQQYDFKDAAKYLASEIADADKSPRRLYVGVFYDPAVHAQPIGRKGNSESSRSARSDPKTLSAESKDLLRQQVQEFAAWLKQQGAI